jgi:ubiquitin
MFDSWYAWPELINAIRNIKKSIHVICRLKDSNVQYEYNGKKYKLSALYQKVKSQLKKDKRTGLLLKRVTVKLPQSDETAVILFSRGYCEPEIDKPKGSKKKKEPKWVAFLSTDIHLHASTIIKKYTKRWPIEINHSYYIYKIDFCLMISLVTFFAVAVVVLLQDNLAHI